MDKKILELASFLRQAVSSNDTFDESTALSYFITYIDKHPKILNYDGICPLIIILSGLWSSAKKKARIRKFNVEYYVITSLFYEKCLRSLMERDVNINIHQKHIHMSTLMHWLVAWDRPAEAIDFLNMADEYKLTWSSDERDNLGNTVLTLLAARKYLGRTLLQKQKDQELIEVLINFGANLDTKNDLGYTPLDYICMKHDKEAYSYIMSINDASQVLNDSQIAFSKELARMPYNQVCEAISKVYVAAKISDILPREYWQNNPDLF